MPGHKSNPGDYFIDFAGCKMPADTSRYWFLNVIGAGSFGQVYKAVDLKAPGSPFVAIKCMRHRTDASYCSELQIHRKVSSHPNIVSIRDWFTFCGEYIMLVMDFCDGGDLTAALAQGRFFNNEELVKKTMVQLIDALQHCHENGIQHRDLKLRNVLLGPEDQVYLADFGMSTEAAISEDTGRGTIAYLSPEGLGTEIKNRPFALGRPFSTVHSDIWAVGIILVNLITSYCPWSRPSSTDTFFATFMKDPDSLYKTLSISRGVRNILRPVFTMNPLARTPLPELRKQILAVDTFWKTHMEPQKRLKYSPPPPRPCINLDSTTGSSSDSSFGPITPPINAFEPAIQVPDMSAGQDIGEPFFHVCPRHKISSRRRFLKRAVKIISVL
ncbi:kinase-like domain-containing protein [Mycena floridula]|nr:kinase-like domain-containing protein [Mycena floridula]